jgi:hypothetical protein
MVLKQENESQRLRDRKKAAVNSPGREDSSFEVAEDWEMDTRLRFAEDFEQFEKLASSNPGDCKEPFASKKSPVASASHWMMAVSPPRRVEKQGRCQDGAGIGPASARAT